MTTVITWGLALAGPAWNALSRWLPGLSKLRSAAIAAGALALLAGVAFVVWQVNHWGDEARASREAKTIVDSANAKAELKALTGAIAEQAKTLIERTEALEASEMRLRDLEKQQKEARDASPNPDEIVVPAGDPWLAGRVRKRP